MSDRRSSSRRECRGDEPRRARVLFINRSYWPDVEATGQYLTELCEDLADDFDVHVLCGQPQGVVDNEAFDRSGCRRRRGVTIYRVRHTRFDKASFWGRVANMLTFLAACARRSLRVPRADVVIVETDPPLLCLLGWLIKRVRGSRLVCYLQDIYPDVAVALGKLRAGFMTRRLRQFFFGVYRRNDAVVALSGDMRELLIEGGVPADKIELIPNWVDVEAVFPVKENNRFRHRHDLEGKFVAMYSGNMGLSQRLEQVLDAADLLRNRDNIVFALIGHGVDRLRLERVCTERRLTNVRFFNYQSKDQLAESLSAADLHLVVLRPEVQRLLMPSKIYGALASGTAVLAIADAGSELSQTIAQNDLGCNVPVDDAAAIATTIEAYADSPELSLRQGRRARQYAVENCRRETSVAAIRLLLDRLSGVASPAVIAPPPIPQSAIHG